MIVLHWSQDTRSGGPPYRHALRHTWWWGAQDGKGFSKCPGELSHARTNTTIHTKPDLLYEHTQSAGGSTGTHSKNKCRLAPNQKYSKSLALPGTTSLHCIKRLHFPPRNKPCTESICLLFCSYLIFIYPYVTTALTSLLHWPRMHCVEISMNGNNRADSCKHMLCFRRAHVTTFVMFVEVKAAIPPRNVPFCLPPTYFVFKSVQKYIQRNLWGVVRSSFAKADKKYLRIHYRWFQSNQSWVALTNQDDWNGFGLWKQRYAKKKLHASVNCCLALNSSFANVTVTV